MLRLALPFSDGRGIGWFSVDLESVAKIAAAIRGEVDGVTPAQAATLLDVALRHASIVAAGGGSAEALRFAALWVLSARGLRGVGDYLIFILSPVVFYLFLCVPWPTHTRTHFHRSPNFITHI
jgi:hypothetical protein